MSRFRERVSRVSAIDVGTWESRVNNGPWTTARVYTWRPEYGRYYRKVDRCWDETHKGPPFDDGGALDVYHFNDGGVQPGGNVITTYSMGPYTHRYSGAFVCTYAPWTLFYKSSSSFYELGTAVWDLGDASSFTAQAWNRFKPGQAGASLAVFLGEMTDLPRMLKTTAYGFYREFVSQFGRNPKRALKGAADQWLNHQFGWLPFVSDVRKLYNTWANLDKMLKQLERDNGQWIKRKGNVKTDTNVEVVSESASPAHWPGLSSGFYPKYPNLGHHKVLKHTDELVWFSGRFRYYIPDIGSVEWKKRAKRQLFGANLTPAVIWELVPWSWLIDWFSNLGTLLENLDDGAAENLAAKYAYTMRTYTESYTVDSTVYLHSGPQQSSWTYDASRKQRVEANPFGFDSSSSSFSARQWSILGALGISKLKF